MLVDGDTGYGEALNVMHMVRAFEESGAAAVHIEDQLLPKKCGHLNDKRLADARDMAAKVAAARAARRHLVVVARTDAVASEGMDGAVARARLYLEAGADAIFVNRRATFGRRSGVNVRRRLTIFPEALTTAEMFREFAGRLPGIPLLANMTEFGRTPFFTASEFEAMGYRMVIWPVSALRCANKARRTSTQPSAMMVGRIGCWSACRRAANSTLQSDTPTTKHWTGRLLPRSYPKPCRNDYSDRPRASTALGNGTGIQVGAAVGRVAANPCSTTAAMASRHS